MASVKHAKTNTISDWTQTQLDAAIAAGSVPAGTVLTDIVLPSDWNAEHEVVLNGADVAAALGYAPAAAADLAGYQPLDSDLSALAALATTGYGRALLTLSDAAAGRGALGLGSAATQDASTFDAAGAAASALSAALSASQPLDADLTAIAALTTTAYGRAFLALADAAAGRTALGLGTAATAAASSFDAAGAAAAAQAASQPLDSDLTAIAALTTTSFGRELLALADAAALRTAAGLGTLATQSGTFSGMSSGVNTGDQDLSGYVPTSRTINGQALTGNIVVTGESFHPFLLSGM